MLHVHSPLYNVHVPVNHQTFPPPPQQPPFCVGISLLGFQVFFVMGVISPQNTSVTLSIEMLTRNFNLIVVMTVGLEGLKLLTSYYKTRLHL